MFSKTFSVVSLSGLLIGCAWLSAGTAGETQKTPASETIKNVGPTLANIAVGEFDMMGMRFKPGTAMNFMPTPPQKCGA